MHDPIFSIIAHVLDKDFAVAKMSFRAPQNSWKKNDFRLFWFIECFHWDDVVVSTVFFSHLITHKDHHSHDVYPSLILIIDNNK